MSEQKNPKDAEVPVEFYKIMKDFLNDILTTFPEYEEVITEEENLILSGDISNNRLFLYCCDVYPSRFFDILYKNESMFENRDESLMLLPNVNFNLLWCCNISDKTRETIWKYLQLILFMVTKNSNNADMFGDTAKLFEAINPDELKQKLESTMKDMEGFFDLSIDLIELSKFL